MIFKLFNKLRKNNETGTNEDDIDLKQLNSGLIFCEGCSKKFAVKFFPPLKFTKCPNCESMVFIPYLVEKYWLYKPLGGGGMGSVYKAVHKNNGDPYSVKLLQRDEKEDQEVVEALLKEGEIGYNLRGHPNVCDVVDYGKSQEEIFMVSEFLKGDRLDHYLSAHGTAPEEIVLMWSLQLLSGLQHIYNCGYLYRDMKPQNLIVNKEEKKISIFDFGLCMEVDEPPQQTDEIHGSPQYFPPERYYLEKENMSSEIYSLGMVLFYCLAGEPFYDAKNIDDLLKQQLRRLRVSSVASRLPEVNPDICRIIEKMIKRKQQDRYNSFKEVYEEINDIYAIYTHSSGGENLW